MEIVTIVFLVLLFLGMPVGFAVGIAGATYFLQNPDLPIITMIQLPISQTQNVTLLAVPLFIFAGSLMNASGITARMVKLAMLLAGHMRGGMAQTSVVLSTLMGGCSGSTNADAAMQAQILGPEMERQNYPKGFTGVVIGFTALITSTIPPGIGMILYGVTGQVSIGRLFAAGITSGLILMVTLMIGVAIIARIRNFPKARERRARLREILASLRETVWALMFPFILLGSLRLGIFTPAEVGALACVYAIVIGFFVYKDMTVASFIRTLLVSVRDIGGIMFMIAMSGIFGYGIPLDRVPARMTALVTGLTDSTFITMAIIVGILILFGMFMDGAIVIILVTPILLPLVRTVGVDPVVFGIVTTVVVTMGVLTPPFGIAMYVVNGILGSRLEDYLRESIPFIIVVLVTVFIYLAFPGLILAVPRLLYG